MSKELRQPVSSLKDAVHMVRQRFFEDFSPSEQDEHIVRENMAYVLDMYRVPIDLSTITVGDKKAGVVSFETLSPTEAVQATEYTVEELAKYPPEYVRSLGIKKLRLVKELVLSDPSGKQEECGGLAVQKGQRLYVSAGDGVYYFRRFLHHEMFHRGDERAAESVSPGGVYYHPLQAEALNLAWRSLNDTDDYLYASYDTEVAKGKKAMDYATGFARFYGRMNEEEDRAVIAEELMTDTAILMYIAENDEVLANKVAQVKELFCQRSNGLMNEQYFTDLAEGYVDSNYWTT